MKNVAIGLLLLAVLAPCACASSKTPSLGPSADGGTAVVLTIAPNPVVLSVGQSTQLSALVTNDDGSIADVSSNLATLWTTGDPQTATVDLTGRVVGVKAGQTQINVSFGGRNTSAVVTVAP